MIKIIVLGPDAVYIDKLYYPYTGTIEIRDEFIDIIKRCVDKGLIEIVETDKVVSDIKFEFIEDETIQCQAKTKAGKQCSNQAVKDTNYCSLPAHAKLQEQEK